MGQGPPGPAGEPGEPGRVNGGRLSFDPGSNSLAFSASTVRFVDPSSGADVLRCDAAGCQVPRSLRVGVPGAVAAATTPALFVDDAGARFAVPVHADAGATVGGAVALVEGGPLLVLPADSPYSDACAARFLAKFNGTCATGDPSTAPPTRVVLRSPSGMTAWHTPPPPGP